MSATNVSDTSRPADGERVGAAVAEGSATMEQIGAVNVELYRPGMLESLREARRNMHVLRDLFAMSLGLLMPKTILGGWWIPITFVCDTLVKAFIFGGVLNAPSPNGIPYFIFLAAGNGIWWLFHRGTLTSMRSFQGLRHFVTTFDFPLLYVPFVGVFQMSVGVLVSLGLLAAGFVAFWVADGQLYLNTSIELLLAPLALAWTAILAAAWGLFSAPIYFRARDVRQMYKLALPFLMYLTPVIYPVSAVPGFWGVLAQLNPLAAPVELFRLGVLGVGGVAPYSIVSSLAVTVALFVFGLWFLNRYSLRLVGIGPLDDEDDFE
jgi:lipopolysaccharide transport system permease protein